MKVKEGFIHCRVEWHFTAIKVIFNFGKIMGYKKSCWASILIQNDMDISAFAYHCGLTKTETEYLEYPDKYDITDIKSMPIDYICANEKEDINVDIGFESEKDEKYSERQ